MRLKKEDLKVYETQKIEDFIWLYFLEVNSLGNLLNQLHFGLIGSADIAEAAKSLRTESMNIEEMGVIFRKRAGELK